MSLNFDAIIIGFGKAGKTLASYLGNQNVKVALIEKSPEMYGGTCINIGCIPTKALVNSAENRKRYSNDLSEDYFQSALQEKDTLVKTLRLKNYNMVNNNQNVTIFNGTAQFEDQKSIKVTNDGQETWLTSEKIFINTGAFPVYPNIIGIKESERVYDSTGIQNLADLPKALTIIGAGYIGLEFASMFAQFGSEVTIIETQKAFLPREDKDMADAILDVLKDKGIKIHFSVKINEIIDEKEVTYINTNIGPIASDAILIATGRKANIEDLNLDAAGIELNERGFIKVDEWLKTNVPGIWALGDVNGGPQFTYTSLDDFRIIREQLYGNKKLTTKSRLHIPYSVFITPTFSRVGLTEAEAIAKGYQIKVGKLQANTNTRAHTLRETTGVLKAVIDASTNKILGAALFCTESNELINIIKMAMDLNVEYTYLKDQMFTHPSMSEALNDLFNI